MMGIMNGKGLVLFTEKYSAYVTTFMLSTL